MNTINKKIFCCISGIMSHQCNENKKNNYYHAIIKEIYGNEILEKIQEMTDYSFDWEDANKDELINFLKENEDYGYIVDNYGVMLKEAVEQIQEERYEKLEREFTFA